MNKSLNRTFLFVIGSLFLIAACGGEKAQNQQTAAEPQAEQYVPPAPMNMTDVEAKGARALTTDEISSLIVGKMITIKHLPTGNELTGYYNEDGTRTLIEFDKGVAIQGGQTTGASRDPYRIEGDQLHAVFEGNQISTTIYHLDNRYLAAVSDQDGMVNYEVIPPGRNNKN
ncbi:hypothetical protein [Kaarinaea lacus]